MIPRFYLGNKQNKIFHRIFKADKGLKVASFIAIPMVMVTVFFFEFLGCGQKGVAQEGKAMVRVWHQGWIFGVIKVYIVTLNSHHKNYVTTVDKSIV